MHKDKENRNSRTSSNCSDFGATQTKVDAWLFTHTLPYSLRPLTVLQDPETLIIMVT